MLVPVALLSCCDVKRIVSVADTCLGLGDYEWEIMYNAVIFQ